MADAEAHIEMMLSAEDLASDTITRAADQLESAVEGVEGTLDSFDTSIDDIIGSLDRLDVEGGLSLVEMGSHLTDAIPAFEDMAEASADAVANVGAGLDALPDRWAAFTDAAGAAGAGLGDALSPAAEAANGLVMQMNDLAASGDEGFNAMRAALPGLTAGLAGAATQANDLAQKTLAAQEAQGGMGKLAGGVFGGIGKGLGLVMKLLSPFIDAIVETLSPAFETLGAMLKNTLAPLGFLFETMAQQLAPLIQKLITPLVGLLEVAAVHLGTLLQNVLQTGAAGGPIAAAFQSLLPVLQEVLGVVVKLFTKLFPIAIKVIQTVLPIVAKLVGLLAKAIVPVIDKLGDMIAEIAPVLLGLFKDVLEALMPLVPPLLKLASLLLTKVFGPLLVQSIKLVAGALQLVVPYIKEFADWLGPWVDLIGDMVGEFYDNFETNMLGLWYSVLRPLWMQIKPIWDAIASAFEWFYKGLDTWIISPIKRLVNLIFVGESPSLIDAITMPIKLVKDGLAWVTGALDTFIAFVATLPEKAIGFAVSIKDGWIAAITGALGFLRDAWTGLLEFLGLGDFAGAVGGVFNSLIRVVQSPIDTIKGLLNEWVVDFVNTVLRWDPPVIPGGTVSNIIWGREYQMPRLERGGIATGSEGVVAEVGEAGSPELIQPLTPESVKANLGPLLADLSVPGFEEAVGWLERIHGTLTGTLRVEPMGGQASAERVRERDDLGAAPGLLGTVRG